MAKFKTITPGDKFGRWTALQITQRHASIAGKSHAYRLCQCECGSSRFVNECNLLRGKTKSCGCFSSEVISQRNFKHGYAKKGNPDRVYGIWVGMIARCTNPKNQRYKHYGHRGITVCEHWLKFENFLADMGEPPPKRSLDRLDNDGGYCKKNCAWSTAIEQARNKQNTIKLTWNGLSLTIAQWAEKIGISYGTLDARYRRGWSTKRMLLTALDTSKRRVYLTLSSVM